MHFRCQVSRALRFLTSWSAFHTEPASTEQQSTCALAEGLPTATPLHFSSAAERIKATGLFNLADLDLLATTHVQFDFAPDTPWDDLRGSFLEMPKWFRFGLDPLSDDYARQQHQLWAAVAGVNRNYDPALDEKEAPLTNVDAIRFPGHFVRRDPHAVEHMAQHMFATGMIMKHSGIKPGQWALEYGAGFAQTALQLARLGVNVDTVDISEEFCRHVRTQAEFFNVSLNAFVGRFGWNPRGDKKYNLIWFYESFHHCIDFQNAVRQLHRDLATDGRILLAGEPIRRREDRHIPYPWGLRLDSENVAVVRRRHWFEIGFTEDFLVALFTNAGFAAQRMDCPLSAHGEGYIFHHRPSVIEMATHWLPSVENESWHQPEAAGRWTREISFLTLDATESYSALEVMMTNHHPHDTAVESQYGDLILRDTLRAGERRTLRVDARVKAPRLVFRAQVRVPSQDYNEDNADARALGIFVNSVRYI